MDYHIAGMVHVSGGANGGFQLVQRKLVGDDGFQVPAATGHDMLNIPYILRHVSTGADDALLGAGHVKQIDGVRRIVYPHTYKTAFDLA